MPRRVNDLACALLGCALLLGGRETRAADNPEPPRDIPLEEVELDQLSDAEMGDKGKTALSFNPGKWRHAETSNFILHFRRITEAKKVAREVEYDLWFVAEALKAKPEQYEKKSHVFIFEDEDEWKAFLEKVPEIPAWSASFAYGDELFLNIRKKSGPVRFDSQTLAHECTHAVVARLYPRQRWPLYLNEGFAEYMGSASVAARKNQRVERHQRSLDYAQLSLDDLIALPAYPTDEIAITALYQTSEKLVRYLYSEYPPEAFPRFVEALLEGASFKEAAMKVYGAKAGSYEAFVEGFHRFET